MLICITLLSSGCKTVDNANTNTKEERSTDNMMIPDRRGEYEQEDRSLDFDAFYNEFERIPDEYYVYFNYEATDMIQNGLSKYSGGGYMMTSHGFGANDIMLKYWGEHKNLIIGFSRKYYADWKERFMDCARKSDIDEYNRVINLWNYFIEN